MTPILADANKPESYMHRVCMVDFLYQDVAQRNQLEIFIKNCKGFLKRDGFAMLCIKSRSIDIAKKPREIFREVRNQLEKEITVVDYRELDPFQKDHCLFVCKNK